jgi:hypothetical protein
MGRRKSSGLSKDEHRTLGVGGSKSAKLWAPAMSPGAAESLRRQIVSSTKPGGRLQNDLLRKYGFTTMKPDALRRIAVESSRAAAAGTGMPEATIPSAHSPGALTGLPRTPFDGEADQLVWTLFCARYPLFAGGFCVSECEREAIEGKRAPVILHVHGLKLASVNTAERGSGAKSIVQARTHPKKVARGALMNFVLDLGRPLPDLSARRQLAVFVVQHFRGKIPGIDAENLYSKPLIDSLFQEPFGMLAEDDPTVIRGVTRWYGVSVPTPCVSLVFVQPTKSGLYPLVDFASLWYDPTPGVKPVEIGERP